MIEQTKDIKRVYELGYHMLSSLSEAQLEEALTTVREEISKRGGDFISEGTPELMELAYTMIVNDGGKHLKYDTAYFGWIKFEIDPAAAEELKTEVFLHDKNILRYILIKTVREDTRVSIKIGKAGLRDVKTEGTLTAKTETETSGAVTEEELDKVVDELVDEAETLVGTDDLTKIEGIGPVIAKRLAENGIDTFAALADADTEDIQTMIDDIRGNHDAGTWAKQAALARDGAWDELKAWQDELNGGK